ncbi:hypothetical protein [uncultured Winogradskyella sp.]|uniref:hypothetical protein n=1 Tax=uncultured Winogradskyella sp. TaxID=395353 RepID=UPI0026061AA1|nr:hypothetical protein [uncultured Winogradskyella sp.]
MDFLEILGFISSLLGVVAFFRIDAITILSFFKKNLKDTFLYILIYIKKIIVFLYNNSFEKKLSSLKVQDNNSPYIKKRFSFVTTTSTTLFNNSYIKKLLFEFVIIITPKNAFLKNQIC